MSETFPIYCGAKRGEGHSPVLDHRQFDFIRAGKTSMKKFEEALEGVDVHPFVADALSLADAEEAFLQSGRQSAPEYRSPQANRQANHSSLPEL
ncbi:MAG: hypothetical protein AAB436_03595 [Patescibacteria group bacterium]